MNTTAEQFHRRARWVRFLPVAGLIILIQFWVAYAQGNGNCPEGRPSCVLLPAIIAEEGGEPPFDIEFDVSRPRGNVPFEVSFAVANSGVPINGYSWDFGDGHTSSEPAPSHTYTTPGNYFVQFTADYDGGSYRFTLDTEVIARDPDYSTNEYELGAGRLTKLPASWFYHHAFTHQTTRLSVRTMCHNSVCDTGLIVVFNGDVFYNDDISTTDKGSYLCIDCQYSLGITFGSPVDIYVFSQPRSTSLATVQINTGPGDDWQTLATEQFGGTLVKTGPLYNGDFLEVKTAHRSNGGEGNNNDTHMLLFDKDDPQKGILYNDDHSVPWDDAGIDWDPLIAIDNDQWQGINNFALIGKTGRSTNSNLGIEARVDFIHGPLGSDSAKAPFPTAGGSGNGLLLRPGRYYAWVFAKTNFPVGELNVNRGSEQPHDYCLDEYRGLLNGPAFTLYAEREAGTGNDRRWERVTPLRTIPRGALGSGPGEGWNLFLVELRVNWPARYRLVTQHDARQAYVTFFDEWRAARNPDASDLKVASFNTLYDDFVEGGGSYHDDAIRNAADLLATKGSILRRNKAVEERGEQAPWQWDADVVGLQELQKDGHDDYQNANSFEAEAELRGSLRWNYVRGKDEDWIEPPFVTEPGLGPVFINENVWPTTQETSIFFSPAAREAAGCSDSPLNKAQCELEDSAWFSTDNYTIVGKAEARRFGSSPDRPVAIFNFHLESGHGDADLRLNEMDALISTIDRLLRNEPGAFNNSDNADRRNPKFYQNRLVILGDSNFSTHSCGEHYWMLKKLRDHYGYAVDVSLFRSNATTRLGMHEPVGGIGSKSNCGPGGVYCSYQDWRKVLDHSVDSLYPWWAATYRGSTKHADGKGERYDLIFLVGKGWAYDDPVLDYQVMPDRQNPSPMVPGGGGVEMWQTADLVDDAYPNYAPNYSIGAGTGPGKPALHTDHQPVMARLRVFLR